MYIYRRVEEWETENLSDYDLRCKKKVGRIDWGWSGRGERAVISECIKKLTSSNLSRGLGKEVRRRKLRSWIDYRMAYADDLIVIRYPGGEGGRERERKQQFANPGSKFGIASSIRSPSPSLPRCSNFRGTARSHLPPPSFCFPLSPAASRELYGNVPAAGESPSDKPRDVRNTSRWAKNILDTL